MDELTLVYFDSWLSALSLLYKKSNSWDHGSVCKKLYGKGKRLRRMASLAFPTWLSEVLLHWCLLGNSRLTRGHLPVRKNLHAKEGLCGHLARLRLLASGDPVERIESFFGGPGDDVGNLFGLFSML
jgi:hypothetical protein